MDMDMELARQWLAGASLALHWDESTTPVLVIEGVDPRVR